MAPRRQFGCTRDRGPAAGHKAFAENQRSHWNDNQPQRWNNSHWTSQWSNPQWTTQWSDPQWTTQWCNESWQLGAIGWASERCFEQPKLGCTYYPVGGRSDEAVAVGGYPAYGSSPAMFSNDACRGGTGSKPRLEQISRKLSHVLRHGERVTVRPDGFCRVSDLLHLRRFQELGCTLKDLELVVAGSPESGNSKERFQLIGGNDEGEDSSGPLIRATQGFSRKDVRADCAYRRLSKDDEHLPEPCVHGSYRCNWDSIRESGLIAGGLRGHKYRSEVHFSCDDPCTTGGACAVSGMRSNCDLVIWLDLRRALRDELPFFLSDNHVILSPGNAKNVIPPTYFSKVMDLSGEHPVLLWKDGSPVPEGSSLSS